MPLCALVSRVCPVSVPGSLRGLFSGVRLVTGTRYIRNPNMFLCAENMLAKSRGALLILLQLRGTVGQTCLDGVKSGLFWTDGTAVGSVPCSFCKTDPSECCDYPEAWANCPGSCGTCPPRDVCTNTCHHSEDGYCDDGGPLMCALGCCACGVACVCVCGWAVVLISRGGWERMADSGGDRTSN